jgi:hypothetical protein
VPYQRDAGMTETQARRLASTVTGSQGGVTATVEREGHFFVVIVETASGTFTLRDDEDWRWLRPRITAG